MIFRDEDVAVWIDPEDGEIQIAIRRDFGWPSGTWQIAYHRYRRLTDEQVQDLIQQKVLSIYRPGGDGVLEPIIILGEQV